MWRATGLQLIKRKSIEAPERRRVFFSFFFCNLVVFAVVKMSGGRIGKSASTYSAFCLLFLPPPSFFYYLSRGEQQTCRAGFYLDWNLLAYIPSWWQGFTLFTINGKKKENIWERVDKHLKWKLSFNYNHCEKERREWDKLSDIPPKLKMLE